MSKKTTTIIVIILVVVNSILWGVVFVMERKMPPPIQEGMIAVPKETITPYYIFSEQDNGTTTSVAIGGTFIVHIPTSFGTSTITLKTIEGNDIGFAKADYAGGSFITGTVSSTTRMILRAVSKKTAETYTITFIPFRQ